MVWLKLYPLSTHYNDKKIPNWSKYSSYLKSNNRTTPRIVYIFWFVALPLPMSNTDSFTIVENFFKQWTWLQHPPFQLHYHINYRESSADVNDFINLYCHGSLHWIILQLHELSFQVEICEGFPKCVSILCAFLFYYNSGSRKAF